MKHDAWGRPMIHDTVGAFVDQFVWVQTYLKSRLTTLLRRLSRLTEELQAREWTILARSVTTDFEFAGVLVPKTQQVTLGLHQTGKTRREAIRAVHMVARQLNEGFSPLRAYVQELDHEIVWPTFEAMKPMMHLPLGLFEMGCVQPSLMGCAQPVCHEIKEVKP